MKMKRRNFCNEFFILKIFFSTSVLIIANAVCKRLHGCKILVSELRRYYKIIIAYTRNYPEVFLMN